jgi:hypothetical protein
MDETWESVFESFLHMPSLPCVQAGSVSLIQTLIDKLSLQAGMDFQFGMVIFIQCFDPP